MQLYYTNIKPFWHSIRISHYLSRLPVLTRSMAQWRSTTRWTIHNAQYSKSNKNTSRNSKQDYVDPIICRWGSWVSPAGLKRFFSAEIQGYHPVWNLEVGHLTYSHSTCTRKHRSPTRFFAAVLSQRLFLSNLPSANMHGYSAYLWPRPPTSCAQPAIQQSKIKQQGRKININTSYYSRYSVSQQSPPPHPPPPLILRAAV
jgi:hypothetical protein